MSQTLQNQILMAKSMNGIVSLSDGAGTTITNGTVSTGNISGSNITGNTISGSSFSTVDKSVMDAVITIATSSTPYNWTYNQAQNIVLTGTTDQIIYLPEVGVGNLGTTITIYKTSGNLQLEIPALDPPVFIQTESNASVEVYGIGSLVRVIGLTAIATSGAIWAVIYSQAPNNQISATLIDTQTFINGNKNFNCNTNFSASRTATANSQFVFNNVLPTSTLTPTTATQLITKTYADGILGRNNTWTNTNTFTGSFRPYFNLTNTSYDIGLNAMLYQTANSTDNLVWGTNTLQGVLAQGANNRVRQGVYIGNNVAPNLYVIDGDMINNNCDNNVVIGHNALTNPILVRNSVILGANNGSGLTNITDSCLIGTNLAVNNGFFAEKCVVIGSGNCPTISETSLATVVGTQNCLNGTANSTTIYGALNLTVGIANGSGVLIGTQNGQNLATDAGHCIIGARSGNSLTDGFVCTVIGAESNASNSQLTNVALMGSYISYTGLDNTFYIGGFWAGIYQDLLVAKKNRFLCNRNITATDQTLNSEDPEHIIIQNNTVLNINLFAPATANFGMRFTIVKAYSPYVSVSITASAGLTILSSVGNTNVYTFGASEGFLTLICINTTGTAWIVSNRQQPPVANVNVSSTTVIIGEDSNANATSQTNTNTLGYRTAYTNITGNGTYLGTCSTPSDGYVLGSNGMWTFNGTTFSFVNPSNYFYLVSTNQPVVLTNTQFLQRDTLITNGTLATQVSSPSGTIALHGGVYTVTSRVAEISPPPGQFSFTASLTAIGQLTVTVVTGGNLLRGGMIVYHPNLPTTSFYQITYTATTNGGPGAYSLNDTTGLVAISSSNLFVAFLPVYYPTIRTTGGTRSSLTNATTIGNNSLALLSNTVHLGGVNSFVMAGSRFLSRGAPTIITGNYNAFDDVALYSSYMFAPTANMTIAFPIITDAMVGTEVTLRRVGGTTTTTISFVVEGTNVQPNGILSSPTLFTMAPKVILASGIFTTRICAVALNLGVGWRYAWIEI